MGKDGGWPLLSHHYGARAGLAINPFNPLAGRVDGLTLGRRILPVEWIHPITEWMD